MIQLDDLRCGCGSDQVMAVEPGEDEIRELFLLRRERPPKAWCEACWTKQFAAEAA